MKNLALLLGLLSLSTASFATAKLKCPTGSTQILKCEAASDVKDASFAKSFMDGAVICIRPNQAIGMMISEPHNSKASEVMDVREIATIGGTSYTVLDRPELSIVRYNHVSKVNSKFSIYLNGVVSSRSLICN